MPRATNSAILVGVLLLLCAPIAYAADAPSKTLCAPGTKTSIVPPTFTGTATKDSLQSRVSNSNFCTDDKLTLGPLGQIQEASTCICETQEEMDTIGCGPDQQQPRVTISIKKSLSGCASDNVIISKCAKDPKAAYEAQCKSGIPQGDDIDEEKSVTIDRTPWDLNDLPTLNVPSDTDAMISALTYAGVPSSDAARLSSDSPQNAQEYIRALVERDETAIKASAAKLNINPNLSENIAMLTPPASLTDAPTTAGDLPRRGSETDPGRGSTVFRSDDQQLRTDGEYPTQCGIPGDAGRLMRSESGCGRNTVNPNADVRGPYQFLCGTWNTYARNTGNGSYQCTCDANNKYVGSCPYVEDPLIGAGVVNGQYDLYRERYGQLCESARLPWQACVYAIHFAGEGGFQRLAEAYRQDPHTLLTPQSVAYYFASPYAYNANRVVFERSQTVGGLFAYLDGKMRGDGSVTSTFYSPTGVTTNTGYSLNPSFGGVFTGSSGPAPSQTPVVMSPFANASLFSALSAQTQQNAAQYTPQQVQQVIAPPKAQVSLTIEPRIGNAGEKFTVTWKSSAINPTSPCTLALPGSNSVNVAPNGSQSVTIKNANVYPLVFTCRGLDGKPAVAQDTVFVQ